MQSRVFAALVALALVACGGDPNGAAPASGESNDAVSHAGVACPATFEATNGMRCGEERAVCTIPIACSTFDQQATCTCTDGRFACSDGVGKIAIADAPRCVKMDSASTEICAPTLDDAAGTACTTLGHSCAWPGAICPERPVQNMDTCTCLPDGTTGELLMKCRVAQCNPAFGGVPGESL
jgi:hypothetical protein